MPVSASRRVSFFEYSRAFTDEEDALIEVIRHVGRRGAFIMQQDLHDFEAALAEYIGVARALGVANATDGLEIALKAVGLKAGDEVICCSHTMLATASAAAVNGGVPVPVEIGHDNLIDPEAVEAAITARTVGILPTQLNGRTCDMDALMRIADRHGLFIVEDAAQALGSKFDGRSAGTFGAAAAISFYPAKALGCLGDGGAVVTNDDTLCGICFELRNHGFDRDGVARRWGRNSRLDNIQAAILLHRLGSYPKVVERRRAVARMYQERLGDLEVLRLPTAPDADPRHFDIYQNYELEADERDDLREHLATHGIGTLVQWGGKAVHQHRQLGFTRSLPHTERFFQRCLMLPMNKLVSDDDVGYVCDQVRAFYGR